MQIAAQRHNGRDVWGMANFSKGGGTPKGGGSNIKGNQTPLHTMMFTVYCKMYARYRLTPAFKVSFKHFLRLKSPSSITVY